MPEVKKERTGWRDLSLNDEHRKWGWNCPAIDLDHLFLEYDKGLAVCVIEYKHEFAPLQYPTHPSYRALIDLCNRADLPAFAVRYPSDFSWWKLTALNQQAKTKMPDKNNLSRIEWIKFLHRLRGYDLPDSSFSLDGIAL